LKKRLNILVLSNLVAKSVFFTSNGFAWVMMKSGDIKGGLFNDLDLSHHSITILFHDLSIKGISLIHDSMLIAVQKKSKISPERV
jgi:hypothetical protein